MDEVAAWQEAQRRVCDLVEGVAPDRMERKVPATPDWTGRDLLSHMVGLGADVLAGDEPDDHNPSWTQAQVDARADRSAAELVEEWSLGDPDSASVVVQASDFDLGRALMSRRTADQLHSWTVRGDVTPYLSAFEVLGPLADEDLTD